MSHHQLIADGRIVHFLSLEFGNIEVSKFN